MSIELEQFKKVYQVAMLHDPYVHMLEDGQTITTSRKGHVYTQIVLIQ